MALAGGPSPGWAFVVWSASGTGGRRGPDDAADEGRSPRLFSRCGGTVRSWFGGELGVRHGSAALSYLERRSSDGRCLSTHLWRRLPVAPRRDVRRIGPLARDDHCTGCPLLSLAADLRVAARLRRLQLAAWACACR